MLILISPAKTLDYETPMPDCQPTDPLFLERSAELADQMKTLSPEDLMSLMSISRDLAELNVERFQTWKVPFTDSDSRPSVFAFKGDVYEGLDAYGLTPDDLAYAQSHLRILSGLYGLLRPLDRMRPYRLEMGTKLANDRGKNLYEFWETLPTQALKEELHGEGQTPVVINLASNEYFKVVKPRLLQAQVITPSFLDRKNDQYKMVSFWAKRARGLMTRYLIKQRAGNAECLKDFGEEGYYYSPERSTPVKPVFLRDEPPGKAG